MFLSIGVSEEKFWESTPNELHPYIDAHNMKERRLDTHMWQMGIYVLNAVSVAVQRSLNGRKAKAEYLDKPMTLLSDDKQAEARMTDSEKFGLWVSTFNKNNFVNGQEGQ